MAAGGHFEFDSNVFSTSLRQNNQAETLCKIANGFDENALKLLKTKKKHAIWIDGSIETESLLDDIEFFSVIALDFPTFKDGRSYSHARLLRERYNYQGELRAVGDILQDQLFFMERCGINSFHIRDDKDIEQALNGFKSFSSRYQAAADDTTPISKKRKFKQLKLLRMVCLMRLRFENPELIKFYHPLILIPFPQ